MQKKYEEKVARLDFNGEEIIFKTGKLAPRAESSVYVQLGGTVVFAVVSVSPDDTTLDYFPLTVEYIEKYYAGGIISGSRFLKRERRPSDEAVLIARQIDHSIRSLFPKGFKKDTNVIVTLLSYDEEHKPESLGVLAASTALMLSSLPFEGPSASVLVGVKGDELLINPKANLEEELDGEFIVSVREDRILNIEGWGNEIPEEKMGELLDAATKHCKPLLDFQTKFAKEAGKQKLKVDALPVTETLINMVKDTYSEKITEALYDQDNRQIMLKKIKDEILAGDETLSFNDVDEAVEYVARKIMRAGVMNEGKRTSGRGLTEIRDLDIEVGVLPRVHGSALFRRGDTQCMSIVTLGSTRLMQTLESFEGEEEKRFMHHYNGPSYSLGEAGRFNYYPGRREIGHGQIGENALKSMLPSLEEFPYTIRVVSEILSQRGSSSMAATCGTSLALMEAGVPIKAAVGGISVGLVTNDDDHTDYRLLVDIADLEDFYGDMDFKVTGTRKGVTAIQLDNKLMGVPVAILKDAFKVSRQARMQILDAMDKVIDKPREQLSEFAPKVASVTISKEKIGELIGPGGKNIKAIIEKAGGDGEIDIDITEEGIVHISAVDAEKIEMAKQLILNQVEEPELGKTYTGIVDKVMPYGAFVDVSPAISGLVHVSEMSDSFVKDPGSIVKEGQEVKVKIIKIENGKVSFSMKGLS